MSPESFQYLLKVAGLKIAKKDTILQKIIALAERLCLTLCFLADIRPQQSFCFSYCI